VECEARFEGFHGAEYSSRGLPSCDAVLVGECIQKLPDWPTGSITANGTALCH
jgi:hypothetical protein